MSPHRPADPRYTRRKHARHGPERRLPYVGYPMKALGLLLAMSLAASAGEYACLSNGFRIHADRHEVDAGVVKLHTQNGVIEMPVSQVTHFEQEEYTPPP